VADVKAGHEHVEAPVYSHLTYDILEDERVVVEQPDVLIVEGLNVLQPARPRRDGRLGMAVSDFFDFSVYVDARMEDVQRWYVNRFLQLRQTAFSDPRSYFRRYADLTDEEAVETAVGIWRSINGPNLRENVVPTRGRADLVLRQDGQHRVHSVLLRKVWGRGGVRVSEPDALADDDGEALGDLGGLLIGRRLDHHAHDGLGPRRAQQHPAGLAQLGLRGLDRLGHPQVDRGLGLVDVLDVDQGLREAGHDVGELAGGAAGLGHALQQVQGGQLAVAG